MMQDEPESSTELLCKTEFDLQDLYDIISCWSVDYMSNSGSPQNDFHLLTLYWYLSPETTQVNY